MSSDTQNQTYTFESEPTSLIDIFYKDNGRIYSLVSQIDRGAWQERIVTQEKKQKSEVVHKANVGVTRALGSEFSSNEGEDITQNIQTKTAPFDDVVLNLLEALNLRSKMELPGRVFSRMDMLKGTIRLQNFRMISSIFPILKQNPKLFIEELKALDLLVPRIQELRQKKKKTREDNMKLSALEEEKTRLQKFGKEQQEMIEVVSSMYKFFPSGIGFELFLKNGDIFSGQLNPENLIDSEEVVFANYGESLPAEWNVLGIIDYIDKEDTLVEDTTSPLKVLSQFSGTIKGMLSKKTIIGTIIPILIYRELEVPSD